MSKKLLTVLIAIALAVGISVISIPAFAGMPLPNTTQLSVDLGNGNGAECTTGSCFSMEVQPGFLTWTDIGPGTDLGFILGKNQLCGGPANSGSDDTSGELTAAWFFFGNFGSNCTGTFTAAGGTSVTTGADRNIFDAKSCSSAINCLSLTKLGSWHVAWNAIAIPMGSALGCTATDPTGCEGVTEWTLTPSPVVTGSTYVLKHAWVVPPGDPSGFGDVHYAVILRGTVTLPPLCADMSTRCDDGDGCTTDKCDPATGACSHIGGLNCDDANPCTIDSCDSILGCLHVNVNNGIQCNDNNLCTLGDVCSIDPTDGISKCNGTPKTCAAPDACTDPSCDKTTGACGTSSLCQSGTTCDPPTGVCLGGSLGVNSSNNNFTMLDPTGAIIGGTNDVKFTYNKIPFTSVAVSGQVSNATISSSCPFFGNTWTAHDVAIYAPGTYTVFAGCPPGSPGCGQGTPITFTVGAGELGGHMLFNWSSNTDIDVVDIWAPKAVFGSSTMFIENQGCGTGDKSKVWDLMSKDSDGNGVNGRGMVDGPFINFNANFNLMMTSNIAPPTKPVLIFPADKATGLPTTVEFRWKRSIDYDNDPIMYNFEICTDPTFTGCTFVPVSVASRSSKGMFYAGGAGLFMIGMTFIGGLKRKRRIVLLFIIVVLLSGGALISCNNSNSSNLQGKPLDISEMSHTVTGLSSKTTYYWRVSASDGKADPNVSKTNSFTTQ